MDVVGTGNAYTQHCLSGHKTQLYPKGMFYYKTRYTKYKPGIDYAYTMRKSCASLLSGPSALGSLGPGLPSDLLNLATDRLPTRGWGRPKFHNQVLIF